ncbi:acyl-CoA carboxylase subunit epsilon [Herbidospora sp. RD11066]
MNVVKGDPTPEELAALVVALLSVSRTTPTPPAGPVRSAWREAARRSALRGSLGGRL